MRLSHSDFDLLQRTLVDLYEYRDLEALRRALPELCLKLVPADHFGLYVYDINPAMHLARLIGCWEYGTRTNSDTISRWEKYFWEHPFTRYFATGQNPTALMFSDFFSSVQLRNSKLWELVCQVLEYDRNISLPIMTLHGPCGLGLGRRGKHFTERDRLLLNLLCPHFNRAWRNAEIATSRQGGVVRQLSDLGLLPRESEIAHWMSQGKTNPEIATILQISPRTVEKHMEHILAKLAVENRAAAAVMISGSTSKSELIDKEPRNTPNTRTT
jgi:DNA-binding CsgD family transcriptional regulator